MGYTHYWEFQKPSKGNTAKLEKNYQQAVKDITKVVTYIKKNVVNLSGYTVHCKLGQYGGVNFNGVGSDSHETFYLREHYKQNEDFNFCKTARKGYDIAVCAALAILKYRLGDYVKVSSDGDSRDWKEGIEIAKKVLKRKISNPIIDIH